jgi:NADH dehydrogenase
MFLNVPYEEVVKKENKTHKPRVILVGYGWGSKGFLNNIDKNKYDVTLISKDDTFSFTPGLHHFLNYPELLNRDILTSNANNERETKFIHAQVNNVDFHSNIVQFNERKEHDYSRDVEYSKEYDYIIFSHGTEINTYGIYGIKEHSYSVKTFDDICNLRQKLNELNNEARIVVMGCGPLGIELLGSIMDYKNANNKKFEILGLDAMERPLSMFHVDQSREVINHFNDNNINLYMNRIVKMIDTDIIHIKNGDYFKPGQYGYDDGYDLRYDVAIWCGGVKNTTLTDTLFDGQLIVNDMLNIIKNVKTYENKNENKVVNIENSIINNAYAVGDCVQYIEKCPDRSNNMEPRELIRYPKTGQVAYQQGKYLANQFNNNFVNKESFQFKNMGQFCYIGNGKSLYTHPEITSGGYLAGIMNNIALVYNLWKI